MKRIRKNYSLEYHKKRSNWGGAKFRTEVIDLSTGIKYRSINEASIGMDIQISCLSEAKTSGSGQVRGIPVVFIETQHKGRGKTVRCVDTGEIFHSIMEAEEKYRDASKQKSTKIPYCLKNDGIAYGMKWELLDE